MTPEEKNRIEAETEKLKIETKLLQKGGWGKPSSWIPLLVAVAAIASSLGQLQYSSIKEREESLDAREKVIMAKVEESRILRSNIELEVRSAKLTEEIQNSTSEILKLKEQISKTNEQILAMVKDQDQDGSLVAKMENELEERNKQVATIVASAESRSQEVQILNLVWQMNSGVQSTRKNAVADLIKNYNSNGLAISLALQLLETPQLETLSSSGRINVLVFLRNTKPTSWSDDLKSRGFAGIDLIRQRAEESKAFIGPQTDDALRKLDSFLNNISASNNLVE